MNGKGSRSTQSDGRGATAERELVDIAWVAKAARRDRAARPTPRRRGAHPRHQVGHLLRFDPEEIESWIDDARRRPSR